MNYNYIEIFYHEPSKEFVARLKDHPGISALGKTADDAYEELKIVLEMVKEMEKEEQADLQGEGENGQGK